MRLKIQNIMQALNLQKPTTVTNSRKIDRGRQVTHFVNPQTGLNIMRTSSNEFLSGWKLSEEQMQYVLNSGKLGGGL